MINCSASGASEAEQFYNSLNFESIAHQSKFYVTDDFILPDCEFCVFSSSDDSVIEIIDNTAVVKQKVYKDSKVSLKAQILNGDERLEKIFDIIVPAEKRIAGYNETFIYPELLGDNFGSSENNTGWKYTRSPMEKGIEGIFVKKDNNYAIKISRNEANDLDYAICEKSPDYECANKVNIFIETMFESETFPQIYLLKIYGKYKISDDSYEIVQIAEIQFHFNGEDNKLVSYYYDKISENLINETHDLPIENNKWTDIGIELNTNSQVLSLSIDNTYLLDNIPFYETYNTEKNRENCISLDKTTLNPFRNCGGGNVYINDLISFCESGVSFDALLSKDKKDISGLDRIESSDIETNITLYNFESEEKSIKALCCVYKNEALIDVDMIEMKLSPNEKGRVLNFNKLDIPDFTEDIAVKFFVLDKNISPYSKSIEFKNNLAQKIMPTLIKDSDTGREYHTIDLYGKDIFRSYFTMPIWSNDGRFFYFYDEDINYYEYDLVENKVKFVDKGKYEYAITVKDDNLYYINEDKEIIKMNISSREKNRIGTLPKWQTSVVTLLQVNDEQTKISVEWYDKSGEFNPEEMSRIPIYDINTGEWDLSHKYGFADDEENETDWRRPNHICINPKYDNLILFSHEGTSVKDRIWICDTDKDEYYNVYIQQEKEFVSHESWNHDGERIIFIVTKTADTRGGIISVKNDGTDRICHNSDYDYLHCAISPDGKYVIADTIYIDNKSKLVLVDLETGESQVLATVVQMGIPTTTHCHPNFSKDGKKIIFGTHSKDGKVSQIGWMDISDIVEKER